MSPTASPPRGHPRTRPLRAAATACALLGATVVLAACDALLTEPAEPAVGFTLQFASFEGPAGGTTTAFRRVDRVALRFIRADSSTRDTVVAVTPADGRIRVPLTVESQEQISALGVAARLSADSMPLFEGAGVVAIVSGQPSSAEIPLVPIPDAVIADSGAITLSSVGGTVTIGASVFYATGDTVDGYPVFWTTADSSIAVVSPNGIVLPVGVGQTTLEARADTLVDSVTVDVLPPPVPQTVRWLGAAGGVWSDGSLWSRGIPPVPGDTVVIDLAGSYSLLVDVDPPTLGDLRIGATAGLQRLLANGRTISTGGVTATSGASVELTGSTLTASGPVTASDSATIQLVGGSTLNGATVDLFGTANLELTNTTVNLTGALNATEAATVALEAGTGATLGAAFRVSDSTSVVIGNSSLAATAVTVDPLATLAVERLGTVAAPVTLQGALLVQNGGASLAGGLGSSPGSLVRVGGLGTVSQLTLPSAWTNNGQLELFPGGQLTLTSGTLTNAAGASLLTSVGSIGGSAIIDAPLDNQGSMSLSIGLRLTAAGAAHANSGGITAASGVHLEVLGADAFANTAPLTITDGQVTMTLTGTGTGLSNSATIALGTGAFQVSGGPFTQTAGGITGTGVHRYVNLTGSISNTLQTGVNAPTFLQFDSSSITVPSIAVASGTQLLLEDAVVAGNVTIAGGALAVIGADTSRVTGSVGANAGSRVTIEGGSIGSPTLEISGGMTNDGLVELLNSQAGANASLTVSGGTLLNDTAGIVRALPGAGGGLRRITAAVTNQGDILPAAPFEIDATGTTFSNLGLIRTDGTDTFSVVGADGFSNSGTMHASTGDIRIGLSGAAPGFQHASTITIAPGLTFEVSGGDFAWPSGTIGGAGTLRVANSTATVTPSVQLNVTGPDFLELEQTSFTVPTLTTSAGTRLTLRNATLAGNLSSSGETVVEGASSVSGSVTTTATSDIWIRGSAVGPGELSVPVGFTSDGVIRLTSAVAGQNARLAPGGGTLTNGVGGQVIVGGQAGGGQYEIASSLTNNGSVSLSEPLNVTGALIDPVGAGPTSYSSTNGSALTVAGLNVDGGVFDNLPLVSVGGPLNAFSGVTFQNMDPTVSQLSITHPGLALASFTATGLTFSTVPTTGFYITLDDSDGAATAVLTMVVLTSTPLTGSLLSQLLNGALLTW